MQIQILNTRVVLNRLARVLDLNYPSGLESPLEKLAYLRENGPSAVAEILAQAEYGYKHWAAHGWPRQERYQVEAFLTGVLRTLEAWKETEDSE